MIRAFPVIYNDLKSGYLHNWTEYAKYLNSDVNSLYEYLAYFHPDYIFLNDSIPYATDTGGTGTIEAPFTEEQLFTYGLKCHCFVVRLEDGTSLTWRDSFSVADEKPTAITTAATEYLIYDNGIYVGQKSGNDYTKFASFSSSDNPGSIAKGIVTYTIYFPYYLHYHQGMVNTDANSMAFFGRDAEWEQIGGLIVGGTKEKYYLISQTQYDLILASGPSAIELRLKNVKPVSTEPNQIVYPTFFQFQNGANVSEKYEVNLDNIRFIDMTNSNIYHINIVLPDIKEFPSGTLVISNAQTTKGMDIPTSEERLNPDNYIFIPKNNPGIYAMSFNESNWIFTYNSQLDASLADSQYFSFNTYTPRYSNFNEATSWWIPFNSVMTLPAAYYENTWDTVPKLYIADRVGYIWNNNIPLQHELYHVRKQENGHYRVEHFIASDHGEAYLANVANKAVGYYTITIENGDDTPTVTQDRSVYIQIR